MHGLEETSCVFRDCHNNFFDGLLLFYPQESARRLEALGSASLLPYDNWDGLQRHFGRVSNGFLAGQFIFYCLCDLSWSLMLGYLNCYVRYEENGFLHKTLLGVKREYCL